MRRAAAVLLLAVGAGLSAPQPALRSARVDPEPTDFYLGGIQVNEPDLGRWVEELRSAGLDTASVTVYAHQGDWDRAHLWWSNEEPAVLSEIRAAKRAGLKVVLILRVALDHAFARNRFLWHGMIMPRTAEEIESWFDGYGAFVGSWAAIAEREGVDVLGIGSELKSLTATLPITRWGAIKNYYGYIWYQRVYVRRALAFERAIEAAGGELGGLRDRLGARRRAHEHWARQAYLRDGSGSLRRINERRHAILRRWLGLIDEVRAIYGGRLTYAANFDNYRNVGFWHALDLIGINAYFPLRDDVRAGIPPVDKLDLLREGWRRTFEEIRAFRRRQGLGSKRVLFTEIGYTRRLDSSVQPWAHEGFSVLGWKGRPRRLVVWSEQPIDERERRLALRALRERHQRDGGDLLCGLLYWKLTTRVEHEAIEPFALHVGPGSDDLMLAELAAFATGR